MVAVAVITAMIIAAIIPAMMVAAVIARLAGHGAPPTTQRYVEADVDAQRRRLVDLI
jgi:hypothetical protein